eukprot:TRINITY_DN13824_c0_g1_i1.p1 TRINITY_DN13824_c0_g1~~TRINITY_DN13824_c0_g1_i1.p1  ORF type:complete len:144 (-),score=13.96 TRINITY_DN13824_c0_g1_i1:165-596(-)
MGYVLKWGIPVKVALERDMDNLRSMNGVIFVYDVTDLSSFEHVKSTYTIMKPTFPALFVGTKCDQIDNRAVDNTTVAQYANERKILFFETPSNIPFQVSTDFDDFIFYSILYHQRHPSIENVTGDFAPFKEKQCFEARRHARL